MAINKDEVHSAVEVFYQRLFKTFYINSEDGKTFIKPVGVFVSLGITSSTATLEGIRTTLSKINGYTARLAEIKSEKIGGQFLNSIVSLEEDKIEQYDMESFPADCYGEEDAKSILSEMKSSMIDESNTDSIKSICSQVSKLAEQIERLDSNPLGWANHYIQKLGCDYKIFHKKVNYKKDASGAEYRIGIYVTEI